MDIDRRTMLAGTAALAASGPAFAKASTKGWYDRAIVIDALGGVVTKAVSPEPRKGAPAPRVAEFEGGMINAVGLANPGLASVREHDIPWLERNAGNARVIVNVVGSVLEDFATVVEGLTGFSRVDAFELNVSCPNTRSGGMEFGADRDVLGQLIGRARASTPKPLFVKLSPTLSDIAGTAEVAVGAGADGITLVNTIPGLVVDIENRRPALGFGTGGVSGPGLLPVGVLAVWKVSRRVNVPLIGVGGVTRGTDAIQYMMAGATLVAIGTAALRDPRAPERAIAEVAEWCDEHKVKSVSEIVGSLEWPS